ncbi:MAG: FG-GAP-like repeat-containing protein, partial [bacterium]
YRGGDGLKIGIGDGKGNFKITTKPFWFYEFFSTDLNGDGYPDIAGLSGVTYIPPDSTTLNWSIAFNDGSGNFIDTTMFRIGGGGRPEFIIATDLDNDGDKDIVIASIPEVNPNGVFGLDGIIVGKNNKFGYYNKFDSYQAGVYLDISCPLGGYVSDFNNDGFNDVAVIGCFAGNVALNSDSGTFGYDEIDNRVFWGAELSAPITGGDINGDGWIDMVISGYEWPPERPIPYYTVKINNHSYFSRFDEGNFNDTLPDGYTYAAAIADLNMDDRADIVHCSGYGTYITFNTDSVTNVKEENNPVTYFNISDNYPNPFNSNTYFEIQIAGPQTISISIFNILGKEVRELENKRFITGRYKVNWDGKDDNQNSLPSGVYLIRVQAGKRIQYLKSILLK